MSKANMPKTLEATVDQKVIDFNIFIQRLDCQKLGFERQLSHCQTMLLDFQFEFSTFKLPDSVSAKPTLSSPTAQLNEFTTFLEDFPIKRQFYISPANEILMSINKTVNTQQSQLSPVKIKKLLAFSTKNTFFEQKYSIEREAFLVFLQKVCDLQSLVSAHYSVPDEGHADALYSTIALFSLISKYKAVMFHREFKLFSHYLGAILSFSKYASQPQEILPLLEDARFIISEIATNRNLERLHAEDKAVIRDMAVCYFTLLFDTLKKAAQAKNTDFLDKYNEFFRIAFEDADFFEMIHWSYNKPATNDSLVLEPILKLFFSTNDAENQLALRLLSALNHETLVRKLPSKNHTLSFENHIQVIKALYDNQLIRHEMAYGYFKRVVGNATVTFGDFNTLDTSHFFLKSLSRLIETENYAELAKQVISGLSPLEKLKFKALEKINDWKGRAAQIQKGTVDFLIKKYVDAFYVTELSSDWCHRLMPMDQIQMAAEAFVRPIDSATVAMSEQHLREAVIKVGLTFLKEKNIEINFGVLCVDPIVVKTNLKLREAIAAAVVKESFQDAICSQKDKIIDECVVEVEKQYNEAVMKAVEAAKKAAIVELQKPEKFGLQRARMAASKVSREENLLSEKTVNKIFLSLCSDENIVALKQELFSIKKQEKMIAAITPALVSIILLSGKRELAVVEEVAHFLLAVICQKKVCELSKEELSIASKVADNAVRAASTKVQSEEIKEQLIKSCASHVAVMAGKSTFERNGNYHPAFLVSCAKQCVEKFSDMSERSWTAEQAESVASDVAVDAVSKLREEGINFVTAQGYVL